MTVDVLVIGGGPAGATVARLLATWGQSVLVLTRPSAQSALAESIPPSTRKLLRKIEIADVIDRGGFIRTTGNTIWWGSEERTVVFPDGDYGYQVERHAFDALLLEQAELAGVRVHNEALRQLSQAGAQHVTSIKQDGRDVEVRARWVLDCSGRSGFLARSYRRPQPGRRTLALIAMWQQAGGWGLADETHTLVESYETGWAWSVPVSASRRCIAFMVDPDLTDVSVRSRLTEQYQSELRRTHRFAQLASDAELLGLAWACDASPYDATSVSGDNFLLVGDAASFVDPLSSFGVKKALASAWLAAVVTHTALTQPELRVEASKFYQARERAMFDALQRQSGELARAVASAHVHAFWSERSEIDGAETTAEPDIDALRRDPELIRAFETLKARDSIELKPGRSSQRVELPVVKGNRIALATHLKSPAFPEGIRYVRAVDLVTLADLAVAHHQVPDLYDAYQRSAQPVELPDFLGALSLLVARGLLEYA
jgi:flavin-dependent dehydrogenase